MTGHLVHHLVRRGVQHVQHHLTKEQLISKLQQDAELYENAGPEMQVYPREFIPVVVTALVAAFVLWSIDYTIGQVMSSLAMIESPSRAAIIDSKPPPAYNEKEPVIEAEAEADTDIEVTIVDHVPITASIKTTIHHLHRVGGFTARWRGLRLSIFYHFLHSLLANFLAQVMGFGIIGEALSYIFVSVGLARIHMAWTHKMISYPSSKAWFRRLPARKDCKALLLPSLVYATAQQATILLPVGVAVALQFAGQPMKDGEGNAVMAHHDCSQMANLAFRVLAVPTTFILVGLAVLLPAAVTLTRIEASLLPEGEDTIVPFDKAEMMEGININERGGCRALFVQAWKSFDRTSRLRLIKLYAKMIMAQLSIVVITAHLIVAEIYVIGGERIAILLKSGAAQLKLMAMEAHGEIEAN